MLRGALSFWWARFLGRPRWSEGPQLSGRAFLVGFRTDFVISVWASDAFAQGWINDSRGGGGGGGLDLGPSRKRVPKCLKGPKTTYTYNYCNC